MSALWMRKQPERYAYHKMELGLEFKVKPIQLPEHKSYNQALLVEGE